MNPAIKSDFSCRLTRGGSGHASSIVGMVSEILKKKRSVVKIDNIAEKKFAIGIWVG